MRSVGSARLAAGQHAERDAEHHREQHSQTDELQRPRDVVEDHGQRRVPSNIGAVAEVEAKQATDEVHELHRDALVEPQRGASSGALLLGRRERQHELHGIAHKASDDEDEHGHPEDDHEALCQSSCDVASHDVDAAAPGSASPAQPVTDISLTRSFESTRGVQVSRVESP